MLQNLLPSSISARHFPNVPSEQVLEINLLEPYGEVKLNGHILVLSMSAWSSRNPVKLASYSS